MMAIDDRRHDYTLYVLECEGGKYYVGVTTKTAEERFREHVRGKMAAYWTKHHQPLRIVESRSIGEMTYKDAQVIENKKTREMIKEKGLNNVRGGDLRADEELVSRFGRVYGRSDWEAITTVVLLLLVILYFLIDRWLTAHR